jgi:hypothetical protein
VRCAPTGEGGVAVEVVDQGEGISAEDQERIFHEFVQLGKTQLQDGTGLGLPISRRLAELLHGSLTVHSTPGGGSCFKLELPATADARPTRAADQETPRKPTSEPGTSEADADGELGRGRVEPAANVTDAHFAAQPEADQRRRDTHAGSR